jgi:hypothetical protein
LATNAAINRTIWTIGSGQNAAPARVKSLYKDVSMAHQ